ncbi:hypothetical protein ScalyP_jg11281 [Parmales sp. scaly parma]|nr:hypothetical protein ScalyP_jg11281 [Parmales sp. scaly parma]
MKTFCLLLMGTFSNTSSLTSSSPYCGPNTVKKTFKHKSFDIKYQQAGDPSNPPVLLIHGFGASSSHFRYNIPVLAVKNCVYAIDLLGFGDSSKPKDLTFTMDTFTTLCEDFIQSTPPCPSNHNKWIVAGNSIGGLTAINLAASSKVKELIRGVILFNSSGGLSSFRYADYPFYLRPILFVVQNVVLKNFGAAFYKNFKTKENVLQILNEQVYADTTNVDEPLVDMLVAPSDDDGAQEVFLSVFGAEPGTDPQFLLPKIEVPVLALWGTRDNWTPLAGGEKLKTFANPRSSFELVPIVAGHCLHDEVPETCHKYILPWIDNLS